MRTLIAAGFSRVRTVGVVFVLLLLSGAYAYVTIPKEAAPEVTIPVFIINVSYSGISAEDSVTLLVRPLERQLQGMPGLRRMQAQAGEGFATVQVEFDPGGDVDAALTDVRDRVDRARSSLPPDADEPTITEIDTSLFPILTIGLSGPLGERALLSVARQLRDAIESSPGVLEVDIAGDRRDMLEILIDPLAIESYRISYQEVIQAVANNNRLIAAGAFDTGTGRISVSIPGLIEDPSDLLSMPVRVEDGVVVRLQDVAIVRQTFEDPTGFARINGQPTIALEIRKMAGANIIDTVARVEAIVEASRPEWPPGLRVDYLQNQADDIEDLLGDLENNVIAAILLVVLTTILALGLRASMLVAVAIPGSFLTGILAIQLIGFTLNIVVLFGLILVIGMLVDGALVVVELADRHMREGRSRRDAFLAAAQRMAWPITASTATTLAVFLPLLFWPGTAGEFMQYLPATVLVTLTASLFMALVFVPVLGTLFGSAVAATGAPQATPAIARPGGTYRRVLAYLVAKPGLALGATLLALVGAFFLYAQFGRGVDFFPPVEPDVAQVQIQAQGNYSVREADDLVRMVEDTIIGVPGVQRIYARSIGSVQARLQGNLSGDVIGTIQVDFDDWRIRRPAAEIIDELRERTAALPGLLIQIREQEQGPSSGVPVQIEIGATDRATLLDAVDRVEATMRQMGGFVDIGSDRPVPGVEVRIDVDREQAARYGADITSLGTAVQLLTNGIVLGSYLPEFSDEEVDIRLRFPADARTFSQLSNLRINTPSGLVPITNFVTLAAGPATTLVIRVDARNVYTVSADVVAGTTVGEQVAALQAALDEVDLGAGVTLNFGGQIEDQQEAASFLVAAFVIAVFMMFGILVTQFDSFFQAMLVLSAIIFSIAGVLLGLLVRQEPFSIVMSGIGIVALAGIVVNNNIVLIDTYNERRAEGLAPHAAAIETGIMRLRPVLLTAITTIAGLMPMVLGLTIDFFGRDLAIGAPSGQFWIQLSTAIVGGLFVSTLITVLFTPSMLAWRDARREARAARRAAPEQAERRSV